MGRVPRVEVWVRDSRIPARHIGWQEAGECSENSLLRALHERVEANDLMLSVYPRVSPSSREYTNRVPEEALQGILDDPLNRALPWLNLPTGEAGAVILEVKAPAHVSSRASDPR